MDRGARVNGESEMDSKGGNDTYYLGDRGGLKG